MTVTRIVCAAIGRLHVAALINRKSQTYILQGEESSLIVPVLMTIVVVAATKEMTRGMIFPIFVIDPD